MISSAASAGTPSPDPLPLEAQILLLDMDGTLIDSGSSVEMAWGQLLRELGTTRTFTHDLHGKPGRQVLAELMPEMTSSELEDAFSRIEQIEIELAGSGTIATLPGTQRLLEQLDAAAQELGRATWTIVTSCTSELFAARWAHTGLPTPLAMVTADQVERGKPDPEPYLLGAQRLGADPARAIVMEDSAGGLQSGRAAGARTIAVTTTTPAATLAPLADALVTSLDDLELQVSGEDLVLGRRGA